MSHQGDAGKSSLPWGLPPQQQFGPTVSWIHRCLPVIFASITPGVMNSRCYWACYSYISISITLGISALCCRLLVPGSESGPRSDERMVIKSTLVDPFSTMFLKTPGCSQIWHLRSRTANKKRQMPLQRLRRNLSEWGSRGAFLRMLTMFREVVLNFWLR